MHTVSQQQLIDEVAENLKEHIQKPEWADYVKTGVHKQRPPKDENWWYIRAAAVLRTVHMRGPIGVAKLRTKYGGLKNRGVQPNIFRKGSGSVLRHILQQLEQAGFIKQAERGAHKGRIVTPAGASLLFKTAKKIGGSKKPAKKESRVKKEAPVKEAPKKEAKPAKEKPVEKKEDKKE